MVCDERLRQRAARDRVQQGRLHLDEPPVLQPAPHEAHHAAPHDERAPRFLCHPQVDVALAVAGIDIGDAVPLVGERAAGFGQQHPVVHADGQLARPGLHHLARGPHPVAV